MKTTTGKSPKVSLNTLFWIVVFGIYLVSQRSEDSVVFFNIGQGDSTLIQKGNIQILVDGGKDRSILYELPKYMSFFDREIEYLVLTHPHDDHLVGLLYILENYNVGEILYYPACYSNENYETLLSSSAKKRKVSKGDTIRLDDLEISIVWPRESSSFEKECQKSWNGNINNDSLVLEFTYLNKKFLLMGDAEKEVERVLVSESLISSNYDILKAGHHCSKTSSSETFLNYISVSYAICSCGYKNMYRHPSSETLKNFDKLGVQYLVTYEEGNIQIK